MSSTVLLLGATGQLGAVLQSTVPGHVNLHAVSTQNCDISDAGAVENLVQATAPDVIINAAAYTQVDRAESEPDLCHAVNALGPANLARAVAGSQARILHVSTDFVFDGSNNTPYLPQDATAPLGVYGHSKLAGEQALSALPAERVLILRTAWLYAARGRNFLNTMLGLMAVKSQLSVVVDQIGTPTAAPGLAQALWTAVARPQAHGVHHWTDLGVASWYDFASAIQDEAQRAGLLQRRIPIMPISTAQYPTPARRPAYSVLDKTSALALLGLDGIHWQQALRAEIQLLRDHHGRQQT